MLGKEVVSGLGAFLVFLVLVVIVLLAACYERSVTIAFHLWVANTCVEIYWALNYHSVTSAATLINYTDVAYSQGMLKSPRCLLALYDFHHQGNIFSPYKTHKTSITGCFNQHKQMATSTLTRWWAPR